MSKPSIESLLPLVLRDKELYKEVVDLLEYMSEQGKEPLEDVDNKYINPTALSQSAVDALISESGLDYIGLLAEQLRVRIFNTGTTAPATINLPQAPVLPNTLTVNDTLQRSAFVGKDDGEGNITGTITGTVDYQSGVITLTSTTPNAVQVVYENDNAVNAVVDYLPFLALYKGTKKGSEIVLDLFDINYDIVEHWQWDKDRETEDGTILQIGEFKILIPIDANEVTRLQRILPSVKKFFENYVYPTLELNLSIEYIHEMVIPSNGFPIIETSGSATITT